MEVEVNALTALIGGLILANLGAVATIITSGIKFTRFLTRLEFRVETLEKDMDAAHQSSRWLRDQITEVKENYQ